MRIVYVSVRLFHFYLTGQVGSSLYIFIMYLCMCFFFTQWRLPDRKQLIKLIQESNKLHHVYTPALNAERGLGHF